MNKTSVTTLYLYAFLFTLSAWLCDVIFTADRSCTLVGCAYTIERNISTTASDNARVRFENNICKDCKHNPKLFAICELET